jgi:hypothetical protein
VHLFQGTSEQFIADATQARLANLLSDRFFDEFRYRPAPSEVTSWRNSLAAMAIVLQLADLRDQGVLVELKLPLSFEAPRRHGHGPHAAGELEPDVRVGDWSMPWNARAEAGRPAPGIPKSDFWASDPRGIEQVGCVYTAQGFEFDYVGVIFGPDLVYRTLDGGWVGQRDQSHDRIVRSGVTEQQLTDFVKSTNRVLLTRGLRGCYVYSMDAPTLDSVLSRLERPSRALDRVAEIPREYGTASAHRPDARAP